MRMPRIEQTIFFERDRIVEVRSRPIWVIALEFWFLWVHELFTHVLWERVPERLRDRVYDDYFGDPMEAGFHKFYTWTINVETIDKSAKYTELREGPQQ